MQSSPSQNHRQQQFWDLFIKLLLCLAVLFIAAETFSRFVVSHARPSISGSKMLDHKFNLAKNLFRQSDNPDKKRILFMGDSYTNMAIYPELLDGELKKNGIHSVNSLNIGIPGASPMLSLKILQYLARHQQQPNLVIFNISDAVFNGNQHWPLDDLVQNSYLGQCILSKPDNFWTKAGCQIQGVSVFSRFTGFWKTELTDLFNTLIGTEKRLKQNHWGNKPHVYVETSPQGWAPGYKISIAPEKTTTQSDSPTPWTDQHLVGLIEFCKQQKTPLVLIWLPNTATPKHINQTVKQKNDGQIQLNKIKNLLASKNQWLLDLRPAAAGEENYYDNAHLNAIGAIKTSKIIAKKLSQPPYRQLLIGDRKTP